jgi:hypothetical protein
MSSELGDVFRGLLETEGVRRYFDAGALRAALDRDAGRGADPSLWPILNFALWHRSWIERETDVAPAAAPAASLP